jgi:hypothetical protein
VDGRRAFVYYFAVLERYLGTDEPKHEFDGIAHVLAACIDMHIESEDVRSLYGRIVELCDFVLEGVRRVPDREDRGVAVADVLSAWSELRAKTSSLK